jgi:myo-inositol-1(or 4)-monophosphatase
VTAPAGLFEAACEAARQACELLATARATAITSKSNPRDLVTEWDPRTEQLIRDVLASRAPGIPVLGEEGGQGGGQGGSARRWLVDPIDGTVNFAHGLPLWSIAIALEEAGETSLGVIAAPALGWWSEATRGGGARAYEIDRRGVARAPATMLHVSATARLEEALLVTGFPYDAATHPENNFAEWEHLQRTAGSCRRLGSASLDLCFVAAGWLDGYWERRLQAWDIAGGALIAREAGATVTDFTGGRFDPHTGEVVASNGAIHDLLIRELARVRGSPDAGSS